MQYSDEHLRLIALAAMSHLRLDALEWGTVEELAEVQETADAMTYDEIDVMLEEVVV